MQPQNLSLWPYPNPQMKVDNWVYSSPIQQKRRNA